MAAVEALEASDPFGAAQWLVVSGTLREADFLPLLERTADGGRGDVTLDLFDLETLTLGGCWTIRNLADALWGQGRRLTVVFRGGEPIGDVLRTTGTFDHPRVAFQGSTPN